MTYYPRSRIYTYVPTSGFTRATERTTTFAGWNVGREPGHTGLVLDILGLPYGYARPARPTCSTHRNEVAR